MFYSILYFGGSSLKWSKLKFKKTLKKVFYTLIAIINLILIIAGGNGLNVAMKAINGDNCQPWK